MSSEPGPRRGRTYVLLALLLVVAVAAVYSALERRRAHATPKHVVLVVFDTLRADRMSLYGHSRPTTPYLESVSGELLRYGSVRAAAPWTIPSHATLFTGLWPSEHGAQWGSFKLSESRRTLAEILRDHGFCTFGLSANSFVSKATGLAQGFDRFAVLAPKGRTRSPEILRAAARVLARADDCGRLFLFVNLMDTHIPYTFEPYAQEFGVSVPPIRTSADKWAVSAGERVLSPEEVEQHRAAYDAAVRVSDDMAHAVLGMLRRTGLLDDTLVVFTSDHGDGLGQHPEMGHVLSVWEEQLDVPLVVRLPEARRGGEVFASRVSLAGLTPSILDWLGVPRPTELEGRPTLEETADGPILADYRSYFVEAQRSFNREMMERYPQLAARVSHHHVLYCADHKLIVSPGGRVQLFDLATDPTEQRDLSAEARPELRRCWRRYEELAEQGLYTPFDVSTPEQPVTDEDLERLKALGYVQ